MAEHALAPGAKEKEHKEEECAICRFELFDFKSKKLDFDAVIKLQADLIRDAEANRNFDEENLSVVVIPTCIGCHGFHKECLLGHFENMKTTDK